MTRIILISTQVDLLTSVFDINTTTTEGPHYGTHHGQLLEASLDFESLLNLPTSPVESTSYTSETSSVSNCNRLHSPAASPVSTGVGSTYDQPGAESPSHSPLVTSTFSDPSQWSPHTLRDASEKRNSGSDFSVLSASSPYSLDTLAGATMSSDVRIDVGKPLWISY